MASLPKINIVVIGKAVSECVSGNVFCNVSIGCKGKHLFKTKKTKTGET